MSQVGSKSYMQQVRKGVHPPENNRERKSAWPHAVFGIGGLIWVVLLVEQLNHTSRDLQLFGRYSYMYFGFVVLFGLVLLVWLYALLNPEKALRQIGQGIRWVQDRPKIFTFTLLALIPILAVSATFHRFEAFRQLQFFLVLGICFGAGLLILFNMRHRWQRIALGIVIGALLLEGVLQGLAGAGLLPLPYMERGRWIPYGRVLHNDSAFVNVTTNRFGWYAAPVPPPTERHRVVLIGDGMLEGLYFGLEDTVGGQLQTAAMDSDIIVFAAAGYGPAHYEETVRMAVSNFAPDEIIVALNMSDDLANLTETIDPRPLKDNIYYKLNDAGEWEVRTASYAAEHYLEHNLYDPTSPLIELLVRTLRSHLYSVQLTKALLANPTAQEQMAAQAWREDWATLDPDFAKRGVLLDESAEITQQTNALAVDLFAQAYAYAAESDVPLRVVPVADADIGVDLSGPTVRLMTALQAEGIDVISAEPLSINSEETNAKLAQTLAGCIAQASCQP